ncbi:MAG: hypothetical protein R3C01_04850 [Planctomycetaceae bacterium]
MPPRKSAATPQMSVAQKPDVAKSLHDMLAHINFSSGAPDATLLKNINTVWPSLSEKDPWGELLQVATTRLAELEQESPVFRDSQQVRHVLQIGLKEVLPAYREFHRDQLFHLTDADYNNPFFVGRVLEAVLSQGGSWDEVGRIVDGAVRHLGDFVGYRPIAVLENGQEMALYSHERVASLPLYVAGAGVAAGRYAAIIQRIMEFFDEAPRDLLEEAYLNPENIREIVLDPRSHDHLHPVYKRTNYMFGEWDPDSIDTKGHYTRLVIRRIVLDTLTEWVSLTTPKMSANERLFDAAAALCGTILMASSVSGAGPDSHDSTVSLTTLLPIIARRRDEFYARLISQATGARAKRLEAIRSKTRQPFGHVRQFLNLKLSSYGANQVQHRELAMLEARMGYVEAARQDAAAIPAASIRIETEIQAELSTALRELREGKVESASDRLVVVEDFLHRGIDCGAIVDPWSILGFQGQYPLFQSREDSIPDSRIESLLAIMEDVFHVYTRAMVEAAILGKSSLQKDLSRRYQTLAEWWDRFASHVIEDLPEVIGSEAWESANHVADILMLWHQRGHATGDMSFWKEHIDRFHSAHAYGPVVEALLLHHDNVAAFALLTQWLGHVETVGFEAGAHSLFGQLIHWMRNVVKQPTKPDFQSQEVEQICRMFDYLEANGGSYWEVPTLDGVLSPPKRKQSPDWMDEPIDSSVDSDESDLFGAAYDDVTFEDSADDGNWGDTIETGSSPFSLGEFEGISRELEPRLKFLNAIGQMMQLAAVAMAPTESVESNESRIEIPERLASSVTNWRENCRRWEVGLLGLMDSIAQHQVATSSEDPDANIEFDLQLQVKFYLLNQIVMTLISLKNAERLLAGSLPQLATVTGADDPDSDEIESLLTTVYRAVARRDANTVEQHLPHLLRLLQLHPMLYIPFEHGGKADQILRAQTMQSIARFLLRELPRLGLLKQTWHLANTIFKMERRWRPDGQAITEFDRLFDVALRNTVESVLISAREWGTGPDGDDQVLDAITGILDPYQDLWLKHSRTMRLSSVDGIRLDDDWKEIYEFVQSYGGDLFHASQLTLGHVRAVLHRGVEWYIEYLEKEEDPLHPLALVEGLHAKKITRDDACWCLENLYSIVVDKFDRFLEYNTTTTQSDYGQMFYCLLDFLRLEARYDRDAWNLSPFVIIHEMLARQGRPLAATLWGVMFESQSIDMAADHLADLEELEQRHGMKMPAIADHLGQRFIKPLRVNEMVAQVRPAIEAARVDATESDVFKDWRAKVKAYLADSWGSGIDIPGWIRQLDREASEVLLSDQGGRPGAEVDLDFPVVPISLTEIRQHVETWKDQLAGSQGKRAKRTPNSSNGRQDTKNKRHRRGDKK